MFHICNSGCMTCCLNHNIKSYYIRIILRVQVRAFLDEKRQKLFPFPFSFVTKCDRNWFFFLFSLYCLYTTFFNKSFILIKIVNYKDPMTPSGSHGVVGSTPSSSTNFLQKKALEIKRLFCWHSLFFIITSINIIENRLTYFLNIIYSTPLFRCM